MGVGWIWGWGWVILRNIPIIIYHHLVSRGGRWLLILQFLLMCWGSVTLPQSKHSPDPGGAVPGVIG